MSTHVVSPLFVGRAKELARLEKALADARAGSPSAALVGGEAGVGKTRLVREFAARAGDARVLIGGCLELGTGGLPFAPFTAVLRALARDLGHERLAALLPGGTTRGLARLLPEFGEPGHEGSEARARLFEQVLGLLERLGEHEPVILVIEDAHWADGSTRDLLSFLVRSQVTGTRLLITVTYRSDEIHRRHPLRPLLAELGRLDRVQRVELGRFSRREVVRQVAGILERRPAGGTIDTIYARSEGNPLFVEALLGKGEDGPLPESLRDLLFAGVERLPEETQELLRVASAGGPRIEHTLLAAVARLDDETLARALRPAVAGNVLTVDGDGYAFRHALIHEAVYDDLLPGERTRLHTRYAEALGDNPALLPAPRGAVELAHHWHSAHDPTWALISAWQAAAVARASAAYAEQLRMLTRVLELWDRVPDATGRIGAGHVDVLRQTITVAHLAGEFERALAFAGSTLDEIDAGADPITAARVLRQRGLVKYDLSRAGYLDDLRAAAALVPADPPTRLRGKVLESLARMLHAPAEREERALLAREAMAIAHEVGDAGTESQALTTVTWGRSRHADPPDSYRQAFARARAIAHRAGDYGAVLRATISETDVLEGAGYHEEAAAAARAGIADAGEYGLARTQGAFLSMNLAEPLVSLGRWDEALEALEYVTELTPPDPYLGSMVAFAADIALARGDLEGAQARFAESRRLFGRGSYRLQNVLPAIRREIDLLRALGRIDEAREVVARALREQDLMAEPRYSWPVLLAGVRVAGPPLPLLRQVAEKLPTDGRVGEASGLTFAAEAALACGAPDRAAFDAAAAAWAALGQPYPEARTLFAAAEIAVAEGGREEAAGRLGRALELAGRLGATPLLDGIGDLARRARIQLTGGSATDEPRLGLTARETEVLRLVAAGHSNREIGQELFISAKTVSVHVSNILAKLGAGSRGEAAATAHRLHLFDPAQEPPAERAVPRSF
ncbi:helix-turn-helix transcriptional regulator [Microtetraspora sp. NBRC 13810]|uniref:helix-turn-helix transcriptional regulator n=1 Tax=Microtetraspora sp. NBRC 13810 TaxID=3030990 RepID=UPI0024A5F1A2|nr:helix-turn-helix transcriptional regulator [Microtetraspora sp. NBRC 13810]GLW09133.1 helix-turn-helix transcriptional regulator [Microtetraspora sp. NBRC 13810]